MLTAMSDFNPNPSAPQAPPPPVPQAPFGAPGAPPPPTGYVPPGYTPWANAAGQKPPRPAVPVGSALLILGGAMLIAGFGLVGASARRRRNTAVVV